MTFFFVLLLLLSLAVPAFAAPDDPLTVVHNLDDFLFQFIQAIGYIMAGYGAVQVGLSFKTQDASQKSAGLMTLAGGILVIFARSIISLITGG